MLNLQEVMQSEFHWADPSRINPCTQYFVNWCAETFTGPDGFEHFHNWVNGQAFPDIIPEELTRQIWKIHQQRLKTGERIFPVINQNSRVYQEVLPGVKLRRRDLEEAHDTEI